MVKTLLTEYGADSETEGVVKFDGHVIEGATALWCAAGDWDGDGVGVVEGVGDGEE